MSTKIINLFINKGLILKDEKELFIMREENIRKKLYSTSAVKKEGSKVGSSYCCYGVELI